MRKFTSTEVWSSGGLEVVWSGAQLCQKSPRPFHFSTQAFLLPQFPGWFPSWEQEGCSGFSHKTSRGITWATSSYVSSFHRSPRQTLSDCSNLLGQDRVMWPALTQCKGKGINIIIIDNMAWGQLSLRPLENGYVNTIWVLLWKRKTGCGGKGGVGMTVG